jgi:rRNA maturation protein Rpf1
MRKPFFNKEKQKAKVDKYSNQLIEKGYLLGFQKCLELFDEVIKVQTNENIAKILTDISLLLEKDLKLIDSEFKKRQ